MAASLGVLFEYQALEETPSEEDLNEVSEEAGDGWRNLLKHLGVPDEKVDSLLEEHRGGNPVSACFEGLVFWREGNEPCRPPTWSVLLEALEKGAEKREYARELREKIVNRLTSITQQLEPAITQSSQRQPTPPMPTMDKAIGDIVEMYRKGEVSVPHNPKLEDSYDNIMSTFYAILCSVDTDSVAIARLQSVLQERYDGKDNQGVRQIRLPKVPETANGLFKFIFAKSTPYEILLMHPAVEAVGHQELRRELREYESKMIKFLQKSSMSCRKREVPLPLCKDHTHMAVVISKEQVLLSLVLEMKEYFSKNLQLEETLFEGFDESSTVLFFSILRVDTAQLSPKVLSHLSELKRMFGMTHLIVFGYFACDLEKDTIDSEIFKIPATCQDELRPRISSYVQATRDLVQHRDTGMAWFREAADGLDRTFKRVATARIVGRILAIIGAILCIVSVGLLIGGVTSPAGAVLVLVGYPLLLIGSLVTTGASLGNAVQKHVSVKRANRWIRQGSDLSKDLIEKHESYHEELDRIAKLCYKSEEEIVIVLEHNEGNEESDLSLDVTGFHSADSKCTSIVADWKNALEIGAEDTATAFVTGKVIKRDITGYDVAGYNLGGTINRLSTSHPSAASIGLSSVLMVVDIALIAKTAHNMKIKKGTDLANKLRQAADDMEEETAIFKQLANFANELNL